MEPAAIELAPRRTSQTYDPRFQPVRLQQRAALRRLRVPAHRAGPFVRRPDAILDQPGGVRDLPPHARVRAPGAALRGLRGRVLLL